MCIDLCPQLLRATDSLYNLQRIEVDPCWSRRRLELHGLQSTDNAISDHEISIPLSIGRHNIPGCMIGARGSHYVLERIQIVLPEFPLFEIPFVEFPALLWLANAFL